MHDSLFLLLLCTLQLDLDFYLDMHYFSSCSCQPVFPKCRKPPYLAVLKKVRKTSPKAVTHPPFKVSRNLVQQFTFGTAEVSELLLSSLLSFWTAPRIIDVDSYEYMNTICLHKRTKHKRGVLASPKSSHL